MPVIAVRAGHHTAPAAARCAAAGMARALTAAPPVIRWSRPTCTCAGDIRPFALNALAAQRGNRCGDCTRGERGAAVSDTWDAINEALGAIPNLGGGARCVGRSEIFDVEDEADERAIAARFACQSCPAIQPCRDFADTLRGHRRPPGTLAGVTTAHRPVAPPKSHTLSTPTSAPVGKAQGTLQTALEGAV